MERIAVSELTTLRWPFEKDVEWIRRLRFGAIGIWREKLADYGEEKGIELLLEHGISVSSLHWAGGFTGTELRSFDESVTDGIEAIELAAQLNAGCLIVHSGGQGGHTHRHATRLMRHALQELCPIADFHGVKLAIEPMNSQAGRDWTFLTSLDQTAELLDSLGLNDVGIVFDIYHQGQAPDIISQIERHLERICLVQVADQYHELETEQNRCLLGDGQIQVAEIIEAFESRGYDGYYEIEMLGEALEQLSYPDILEHTVNAMMACYSGINSRQTNVSFPRTYNNP